MDDIEQNIEPKKIFDKAREVIADMEKGKDCNGILLTYDPDAETFQFLAINADPQEVLALLLSGMGVVREDLKNINPDRTLN